MRVNLVILCLAAPCMAFSQAEVRDFKAVNVATGQPVTLSDFADSQGIVVAFTSNACAFDGYYRPRLQAMLEKHKGEIQFLLVNSYLEPEENAEKMKAAYDSWGLDVPYLADKDQTVMEALGARKSPEVFLIRKEGAKWFIAYSGAIDDNPQLEEGVKSRHLDDAIAHVLSGKKGPVASTRAAGCSIRRK